MNLVKGINQNSSIEGGTLYLIKRVNLVGVEIRWRLTIYRIFLSFKCWKYRFWMTLEVFVRDKYVYK